MKVFSIHPSIEAYILLKTKQMSVLETRVPTGV